MAHDIIILGSGYAGVWALLAANDFQRRVGSKLKIALVAPEPVLVAKPRLYESQVSDKDVRFPITPLIEAAGADFIPGVAKRVLSARVKVVNGAHVSWLDAGSIVVATGSKSAPPANGQVHTLDSFQSAQLFWRDLHLRTRDSIARGTRLAIVGAGATGLEAAMEASLHFGSQVSVELIEAGQDLGSWSPSAAKYLEERLSAAGVRLRLGCRLEFDSDDRVMLCGNSRPYDLVLWTAGLRPQSIVQYAPGDHAKDGRVLVDENLRQFSWPNVFWAGDVAAAPAAELGLTVMSCQHAIQMGETAGRNAVRHCLGLPPEPFVSRPYVTCLGLGPDDGLFTEGPNRELARFGREAAKLKKHIVESAIVPPIDVAQPNGASSRATAAPTYASL